MYNIQHPGVITVSNGRKTLFPQQVDDLVRRLKGKVSHGINWTWASFGDNERNAKAFYNWIDKHGLDHRGLHEPDGVGGWAIRYR